MDIETIISSMETAENDNRKFALLLILSELIKSNKLGDMKFAPDSSAEQKQTCQELNERLFISIGANFLARLITTRQTTDNSSPLLYKSVALSIITQFVEYQCLVCDPVILSKIDIICGILLLEPQDKSDDLTHNLQLDTFKYLFALSKYCPDFLCQNAGLLELLMEKIILNKNYEKSLRLKMSNLKSEDNDTNLVVIACKLFLSLSSDDSYKSTVAPDIDAKKYLDFKNNKVKECLKLFLKATDQDQTEFKFDLINYLNYVLEEQTIQELIVQCNTLNELTADCLFNILNNLFRANISRAYKELGFILLNNFVKLFQFETIYMKNRSFFYLIIHMLCIEISFNLQDSQDPSASVPTTVIFKHSVDKMSVLYSLMEDIIIILSTASPHNEKDSEEDYDSDDEADFNEEDEEPELKKTIKIIVETLDSLIVFVKDSLNDESLAKMCDSDLILQIASIRLLICWLAHESLLEQELMELMPELIKFAEFVVKSKKQEGEVNVFEFLVPGIQRVLIDQEEKFAMRTDALKKVDAIKAEFVDTELKEKIALSKKFLRMCESHLKI